MTEQNRKLHLLLVEDEMLSALMVEDLLVDAGYRVSKAARLEQGAALAREADIDFAILDINLGGAVSFPIATALSAREVPFVFASAYGGEHIPHPYKHYPMLHKPYDRKGLLQTVESCLQKARKVREGAASRRQRFVAAERTMKPQGD